MKGLDLGLIQEHIMTTHALTPLTWQNDLADYYIKIIFYPPVKYQPGIRYS